MGECGTECPPFVHRKPVDRFSMLLQGLQATRRTTVPETAVGSSSPNACQLPSGFKLRRLERAFCISLFPFSKAL